MRARSGWIALLLLALATPALAQDKKPRPKRAQKAASATLAKKPAMPAPVAPPATKAPAASKAKAKAEATPPRPPPPAAGNADAGADVRKEGDTEIKTVEFTGLDIEGQLKTPQMLYFLNRLRAEFERPRLPHRSFMPELQRGTKEKDF